MTLKNCLKIRAFLFAFAGMNYLTTAFATVTLPSLFSDHMVLQRETHVAVWGKSDKPSVSIIGSWDGQTATVTVNPDGSWKTLLKTPVAGGPHTLTFDDGERLILSDILIGEVWICSGQSNMDMPVRGLSAKDQVLNKEQILANAHQPDIRLFKVPHTAAARLEKDTPGRWQLSDSSTVKVFSAIGFQYAQLLQEKLNVPVGIIHCAWSGTRIEPWISPESLAPFSYVRPANDTAKISRTSPSALFNGMIGPLIGYTLKGVIWYQGESNLAQHAVYDQLMAAMVEGWKKAWQQKKMAFYYVQIAPFNYGKSSKAAACLREAQERAMALIPDSYMVSTVDVGSVQTIHPADKTTVSHRLAYTALARTYGFEAYPYENARVESVKLIGNKALLRVANANKRLVAVHNPPGFEVAGEDRLFYPATVTVRKNKITAQSDKVKQIQAVRYCFDGWAPGTVHNWEGLPLLPFRTDSWAIKKAE